MPKTLTNIRKPAVGKKLNGKAALSQKIPIRDTLPPETNPEILRANRLLIKAAADVRENLANNFEPEPPKGS